MNTPILYVKQGCPYCREAMQYLDEHKVAYDMQNVRGNAGLMKKLEEVSGQTKTPTMVWDGEVLADFGVEQLEEFLSKKKS